MPATYLLFLSIFFGLILASSTTSADEVVDEIGINVPISCSLSGVGMDSHTTTLMNGNYASDVGTTTLKALCNDNEGFAIYAIGYTDDTDGKTVMTNSALGSDYDIQTGTGTSGNSQWAMRLSTQTSPEPTYPISIMNNYNQYHVIPDDYELVAKRIAATDVGAAAIGSTLTSTYQIYVSTTQPAGTYTGKVKYTLIHPNYADSDALKNAVTVVFDGNGLTFPDGTTTNTVKYANICRPGDPGYVGSTYQEVMTSNISTGGGQNGSYTNQEDILQPITINGADKLKVVVDYAFTAGTAGTSVVEGNWDGDWDNLPDNFYDIYSDTNNITGVETYIINGDTVTIYINSWDSPVSGYDKGAYVKVYPIYNTEQPGTTYEELPSGDCFITSISGAYTETNPWKGKWLAEIPYEDCYWDDDLQEDVCETKISTREFSDENDIIYHILNDYNSMKGTTIVLSAYNPYYLSYDGNGASSEIGMGIHQHYDSSGWSEGSWKDQPLFIGDEITLLAPNYKRTNYGFAGWSSDPNAASHINSATLYGPNETIIINQDILNTADNNHMITLYATWLPSNGNLQNWSGCSNMNVGGITALTDTRDNNTYAVAKLADNNCWMIENLRLGGNSPMTLTPANTQSAGILPAATYGSDWARYPGNIQQISNINISSPEVLVQNINQKNYAFGNHYSWYAASNSSDYITTSGVTTTSICPSGWRIPDFSYYNYNIDNSITPTSYPNNYVLSGFISNYQNGIFDNYARGAVSSQKILGKAKGYYWTGSASKITGLNTYSYTSFNLSGETDSFGNLMSNYNQNYYGTDGSAPEGFSVRCVVSN